MVPGAILFYAIPCAIAHKVVPGAHCLVQEAKEGSGGKTVDSKLLIQ